ncbi:MAG TPA: DUF3606 domain-containing protein [Burkholderiaceae bacterium]|nr:DUF3606 domain-containing protein [Burkholderiaceae bacterium]
MWLTRNGTTARAPRSKTLADDLHKRGGSDRARININQEHEVRDWADKLGVTQEQLKEAVRAVGDRADRVQDHLLARARKTSSPDR